jgi:hypothetical protein
VTSTPLVPTLTKATNACATLDIPVTGTPVTTSTNVSSQAVARLIPCAQMHQVHTCARANQVLKELQVHVLMKMNVSLEIMIVEVQFVKIQSVVLPVNVKKVLNRTQQEAAMISMNVMITHVTQMQSAQINLELIIANVPLGTRATECFA